MSYTQKANNRRGILRAMAFLAVLCGGALLGADDASAFDAPTVTATFQAAQGTTSLQPGETASSAGSFYVPVKIDMKNTSSLSVSVKASSDALTGTNNANKINSVPANGTGYTIGQMNNQWGYRWNLGDTVNDAAVDGSNPKNYKKMPTTTTVLNTLAISGSKNITITKYLTLGFGVGVTGETPADTYTNDVTVSVVATPLGMTIFDITYMQDMTADVCNNTKTPSKSVINASGYDIKPGTNQLDTDGSKASGDDAANYVPQTTLIDKRDGKKYLVRKLADGNCWMASNLEFDFVPTSAKQLNLSADGTPTGSTQINGTTTVSAFSQTSSRTTVTGDAITLTNADTDLNNITTWTPDISKQLYSTAGTTYTTQITTGTAWTQNGTDGLRSFSSWYGYSGANTSSGKLAGYSTKTAVNTYGEGSTGEFYQRFGNLYNWTAATLGSGTKVTTDGGTAPNSICPRGWKLPGNTGNDSFNNLIVTTYGLANNATSANTLSNFPLNYLRSGYYFWQVATLYGRMEYALQWSNSSYTIENAYYLEAGTSSVRPQYGYSRGHGFALRCVARK